MLRNHVGIETRAGEQQRHTNIFRAVVFSQFIGTIDKQIDHTPVDCIEFVVANYVVSHINDLPENSDAADISTEQREALVRFAVTQR